MSKTPPAPPRFYYAPWRNGDMDGTIVCSSHPGICKCTMFLNAARCREMKLVKKFAAKLQVGAQGTLDNIRDKEGRTALHFAARAGNTFMCKYLVNHLKLDINAQDEEGNTPLHYAIQEKRLQAALYLVNNGVDVAKANKEGLTYLHYATHNAFSGQKELIQLLISRGAEVDACSNDQWTPLLFATLYRSIEAVEVLLQNNANPNLVVRPIAPLIVSSWYSYEITDLLVKAGGDPNINVDGSTPLQGAVAYEQVEIITYLLKAGADPNIADVTGLTPLENAVNLRHLKALAVLFPVTKPIPSISDWSVDGLVKYVDSEESKQLRANVRKEVFHKSKLHAEDAFERKNYAIAAGWYNTAIKESPCDATLLSRRSLCYSLAGCGNAALSDAQACVCLRPDWPIAHYQEGVAWRLLKNYPNAERSFSRALALDPGNREMQEAVREAVEAEMGALRV
ncbi:unnamed protein product [Cuscuta campestris]|uniref:Serine/threonine-protein kinase BSK1-like TPR repeats domain-containing protein n=1 Tax=Cuscuta campestris TaxID=132261 RepID=A0A484KHI0_9ASTE|nr:unnamed protein product [Cuscuta campestris]